MFNASRLFKRVALISTIQLSTFFAFRGEMLVEHSNALLKNGIDGTEMILTGFVGIGLVLATLTCATIASLALSDLT